MIEADAIEPVENYEFNELNINDLEPLDNNSDGATYIIIGSSGSGKSTIIKSILAHKYSIIPITIVFSETEAFNAAYKHVTPPIFIFDNLTEANLKSIMDRQKEAIEEKLQNPLICIVADDCMNKKKNFTSDMHIKYFKTGRHMKIVWLIACQDVKDISDSLKNQCAGVFLCKNNNEPAREKIRECFIPDVNKKIFKQIFSEMTEDFSTMFIDMRNKSNKWQDKIKSYRAMDIPGSIKDQNISQDEMENQAKAFWDKLINKDVQAFNDARYDNTKK